MGQFLYHLDPDTRKMTRGPLKMELKMINSVSTSLTKLSGDLLYFAENCNSYPVIQVLCHTNSSRYFNKILDNYLFPASFKKSRV